MGIALASRSKADCRGRGDGDRAGEGDGGKFYHASSAVGHKQRLLVGLKDPQLHSFGPDMRMKYKQKP